MTQAPRERRLACDRQGDFPILAAPADGPALAYLDNAATTQKPRQVLDAMIDYYATANSNVGRGYYALSMRSTDRYEQARASCSGRSARRDPTRSSSPAAPPTRINLLTDTLGRELVGPATASSSPTWSTTATCCRGAACARRRAPSWSSCR